MHLGPDADSVVPTGLDLGATSIPGLKPGAIFFRPCGTRFAHGATTCPRSDDRRGAGPTPDKNGDMFQAPPRRDNVSPFEPVDGEHGIPDNPNGPTPNGVEQICIPRPESRGSNPPPATRACSCSPEGATENSPGVQFSPEIGGAQSKSRQGRKKIAPGFNPGSRQPQKPQVP